MPVVTQSASASKSWSFQCMANFWCRWRQRKHQIIAYSDALESIKTEFILLPACLPACLLLTRRTHCAWHAIGVNHSQNEIKRLCHWQKHTIAFKLNDRIDSSNQTRIFLYWRFPLRLAVQVLSNYLFLLLKCIDVVGALGGVSNSPFWITPQSSVDLCHLTRHTHILVRKRRTHSNWTTKERK